MKPAPTADIRATVVTTLRFLADGWVQDADIEGGDNQKWLRETADWIERSDPIDWLCCPLCEEVECDSTCPLSPLDSLRVDRGPRLT